MSALRTALIGCGKVAGIHAEALRDAAESEIVAFCDRDLARAESFAGDYGGRAFSDLETLLAEARPEAVVICTPHPLHAEATVAAAEAGAHVLVEKPMASSLADCDRMIGACKQAGVRLGVISQRRFYEPVKRMKAAIEAASRSWASSRCTPGAMRPTIAPTLGAGLGTAKAAACWSISLPISWTCCNG